MFAPFLGVASDSSESSVCWNRSGDCSFLIFLNDMPIFTFILFDKKKLRNQSNGNVFGMIRDS